MKLERVNVKVISDIRQLNTGSRSPLKLRITYKGTRKYYSTGYEATNEEWDVIIPQMPKEICVRSKCYHYYRDRGSKML